jgi:hypothetical protein
VKIHVAAVEALRKKERRDKTQLTILSLLVNMQKVINCLAEKGFDDKLEN